MRIRPLAALFALASAATALGCSKPDVKGDSDAAPAPAKSAPSASASASGAAASAEVPASCAKDGDQTVCTVKAIGEKVKAELEAAKAADPKLKVIFSKDATEDDLKTVQKIPWVTSLKIDSDKAKDTFFLLPLKDLTSLEIGPTNIESLAGLAELSGLVRFEARGVDELTDASALSYHPKLQDVVLAGTGIKDLIPLKKAADLVIVDIAKTKVSSLSPLEGHAKLEELDISETKVKDLAPLEKDTAIKKLTLAKAPIDDLSVLKNLVSLETLDASGTKVTDLAGLKGLKKLVTVTFANARSLTDLKPLYELKQLLSLDLANTNVLDVASLVQMRKLKMLNLNNTHVRDLMAVSVLSDLEELHIEGTYIPDLAPVARLKKLKKVFVPKRFPAKKIDEFKKQNDKVEVVVGTD